MGQIKDSLLVTLSFSLPLSCHRPPLPFSPSPFLSLAITPLATLSPSLLPSPPLLLSPSPSSSATPPLSLAFSPYLMRLLQLASPQLPGPNSLSIHCRYHQGLFQALPVLSPLPLKSLRRCRHMYFRPYLTAHNYPPLSRSPNFIPLKRICRARHSSVHRSLTTSLFIPNTISLRSLTVPLHPTPPPGPYLTCPRTPNQPRHVKIVDGAQRIMRLIKQSGQSRGVVQTERRRLIKH